MKGGWDGGICCFPGATFFKPLWLTRGIFTCLLQYRYTIITRFSPTYYCTRRWKKARAVSIHCIYGMRQKKFRNQYHKNLTPQAMTMSMKRAIAINESLCRITCTIKAWYTIADILQ